MKKAKKISKTKRTNQEGVYIHAEVLDRETMKLMNAADVSKAERMLKTIAAKALKHNKIVDAKPKSAKIVERNFDKMLVHFNKFVSKAIDAGEKAKKAGKKGFKAGKPELTNRELRRLCFPIVTVSKKKSSKKVAAKKSKAKKVTKKASPKSKAKRNPKKAKAKRVAKKATPKKPKIQKAPQIEIKNGKPQIKKSGLSIVTKMLQGATSK